MSNRKIVSPQINSDIEINPSGEKKVKFSHLGGLIIGNSPIDSENVKLHRGPAGSLQIVSGDDTTPEGLDSPNKQVISISTISVSGTTSESAFIGSGATPLENLKLRRSGNGSLEIATANSTVNDGLPDPLNRADLSAKTLILGNDLLPENNSWFLPGLQEVNLQDASLGSKDPTKRINLNIKSESIGNKTVDLNTRIYQNGDNSLELVSEDASVTFGTPTAIARTKRNSLSTKNIVIGEDSDTSNNIKIRKGLNKAAEVVLESDITSDGFSSNTKASLNVKALSVGETSTGNLKLHKFNSENLELVSSEDATLEGGSSNQKKSLSVKNLTVGESNSDNIKLHKGASNILEIVEQTDTTLEGSFSDKKVKVNVATLSVGNSSDQSLNLQLHKGSDAELEIVSASDTTLIGNHSPNKRQLNVSKLAVGSSSTPSENSKIHRGAIGELEIVSGDDTTLDNTLSPNKVKLNVKSLGLGNGTSDTNIRLHKAGSNELELVLGDDSTSEDSHSPNKADLNLRKLAIGSSSDSTTNAKLHKGSSNLIQVVTGLDTSADNTPSTNLGQLGYLAETVDAVSPIGQASRVGWDSTKKQVVYSDGLNWIAPGEGNSSLVRDNLGFALTQNVPGVNSLTVSLKQKDGVTDPSTSNPVRVSFRSAITSSLLETLSVTSALSLVITPDAKLGVSNYVPFRIYLYLINYNGSVEIAVSQKYFKEDILVSTEALGTTSDYLGKIYSSSARTNVAQVCIGYFESSQTTEGYWGDPITKVFNGNPLPRNNKEMSFISAKKYSVGDVGLSLGKTDITKTFDSLTYDASVEPISFTLSSTGRPVQVMLQPANPLSSSYILLEQLNSTSEISGSVAIYRQTLNNGIITYGDDTLDPNNEVVAQFELKIKVATSLTEQRELEFPPSMISFLDKVSSGIQTYTIYVKVNNSDSKITLKNVRLIGYEI